MVEEKNISDKAEYDKTEDTSKSEEIYTKTIPKMTRDGAHQVGSLLIELKVYEGYKFVQITQEKLPFGDKPGKTSWVTLDPSDKRVREALSEVFKL